MALSGNKENQFVSGYYLGFDWSAVQNTAKNQSTVTVKPYIRAKSGYHISATTSKAGTVTCAGQSKSFSANPTLSSGQKKVLATLSFVVAHNSDGKKSITISVKYYIDVTLNGVEQPSWSASGSWDLNQIPRASSFSSVPASFILGQAFTVTITPASEDFTHTLTLAFGAKTIVKSLGKGVKTADFTAEETDELYAQIPTVREKWGSVTLENSIGLSTERTLLGKIDASAARPVFSDFAYADSDGKNTAVGIPETELVQKNSRLKITIPTAAESQKSASMSKYVVTAGSFAKEVRFAAGSMDIDLGRLDQSGELSLTVKAVDSRGNYTSVSKTVTVHPYSPPESKSSVRRIGNYESDSIFAIKGSISAVGNNALESVRYHFEKDGDEAGAWTTVSPTVTENAFELEESVYCDNTKIFLFTLELSDKLSTILYTYSLPIGKEAAFLDAKGNFYANGLILGEDPVVDFVIEEGTSDIWTYRKWSSGLAECWGYTENTSGSTSAVTKDISFPFAFASLLSASAFPIYNAYNVTQAYMNQQRNMSEVTAAKLAYYTKTDASLVYGFSIQIIGRWK